MSPPTGTYQIKNADYKSLAYIPDVNDGSSVAASKDSSNISLNWNVTKLSNGNYTIQNYQHVSYASCGDPAQRNDHVVGRGAAKQWILTEASTKNQYTIAPSDSAALHWGLPNGDEGKAVVLAEAATEPKNQWIFQPTV
ncbi:hypothetical protein BD410DRAFT_846010 [Rickenella mellea]|uniref:Ricin B lectin domain-containing protein n=1 Tax=Rickenella mellea TaxID=50990 RepID=A0A4Y7PGD1_9AGAM|nr:hypothetical protein BD410DRAFT_846010 [Rickenella mellea]